MKYVFLNKVLLLFLIEDNVISCMYAGYWRISN